MPYAHTTQEDRQAIRPRSAAALRSVGSRAVLYCGYALSVGFTAALIFGLFS